MKKPLSRKLSLVSLALLLLTVMPIACKVDVPPDRDVKIDGPQNLPVNPAFEMNPPIAKNVSIQKLDDKVNNLLVIADFGKGTIKSRYHAIQLTSGKVMLRDDGKGVDEIADDGKFSIAMHDDLEALEKDIEAVEKNLGQIEKEMAVGFKSREMVQRDVSFLKDIRLADFRKGGRIPPPPDGLCRSLLDVSAEHSLMVNSTSVTFSTETSGIRGWTFGTLLNNIANEGVTGVSASTLLKNILQIFLNDTVVNSDLAPARDHGIQVLIDLIERSSHPDPNSWDMSNWQEMPIDPYLLNMQLMAIVNRLDLRGNMGYGQINGGEGRFVFAMIAPNGDFVGNFILEYSIPIHTCAGLRAYAQQWYDLKNYPVGSPAYNTALKAITDVFTARNADPTRANGSALKVMRTNEFWLGDRGNWEMREFKLDPASHQFVLSTTAQEPAEKFNEASAIDTPPDVNNLVAWINAHEAEVLADHHSVPLAVEDQVTHAPVPFLGAKANVENGRWNAPGVAPETRHHFSLNTCTGCHRQETNNPGFLHVGQEFRPLSGFLTGIDAPDPVQPSITHHFNDLAFRANKLKGLLCTTCEQRPFLDLMDVLTFEVNAMVH
ncbi:hypothetical protein SAMN04488109_0424 [Chryseolinea serpens]|uniref:Cytochrome c domain-containing protein n=1 Tax=Chryseolinea serpens TaxID=947013 RepID=A0A1M5K349_9BACT|nr:hypothetical protein [Chryseolinea serpens]SHG47232.1 hypothetical protein SAMN04488109_0424 [Chryseolinea serpens]